MSFDAIVLGAGANGLAAAVRLARGGRRVVLVERSERPGGLCAPRELHPGYRVPGILHDEGLLPPAIAARLGLERHGLAWREAPAVLLSEEAGPGLLLDRDPARAREELARRSVRDADAYRDYRAFFDGFAPIVERLWSSPPPPLTPRGIGDRLTLAGIGFALWRLGRRRTTELLRSAPMCVADLLNERFETPLLVEGLAAPAVAATWSGPWSAGTATQLLLHEALPGRFVAGGPSALVAALVTAAAAAGVALRTGCEAARIELEGDRVAGVTLASGERIDGRLVVATCDPKRALLELVPPGVLPLRIEREVRNARSRGSAAKLHLALDGPLEIAGRPGAALEALRLGGGHVDDLERAFDALKYGEFSERPYLEVRIPSVEDPRLAPAGHHVVSILASYVPYQPRGGWSPERRIALTETILDALDRHVPGIRSRIVASELVTPADLEAELGLTGGQLHHVEPALDQLLVMRPTPALARYATPIAGLYLGGSGCHGGGGATCAAGLLAAEAALARG